MEQSATIKELAAAFATFQSTVANVPKDGLNPYFKSKYSTLENTISTVRADLAKNGLSFSQFPTGENELATILMHSSGEYIKATAKMSPKDNSPQAQGSAITYLRRYALSAVLGIATEDDDDGNSASSAPKKEPMKSYSVPRKIAPADDEAGGAVIKEDIQFLSPEEIEAVNKGYKKAIKDFLSILGENPKNVMEAKKAVKSLTGMEMIEANYRDIASKLREMVEETDPIEKLSEVMADSKND